MARSLVNRLLGVIPAADRGGQIGGAPPPLLQTGEGTFLERAITVLRSAGVEQVFVGVRDARGPVAAQALRAGAEIVEVGAEGRDPSASLEAVEGKTASAGGSAAAGDSASAGSGEASVSFLLLPPTYPGVSASTVRAMIEEWRGAGGGAKVAAPLLPEGTSLDHLPWHELAPLIFRGPGAAHRLRTPGAVGGADLLRIPVTDPGVGERIDTLPLYRRHFPQAFRRRFQKW